MDETLEPQVLVLKLSNGDTLTITPTVTDKGARFIVTSAAGDYEAERTIGSAFARLMYLQMQHNGVQGTQVSFEMIRDHDDE